MGAASSCIVKNNRQRTSVAAGCLISIGKIVQDVGHKYKLPSFVPPISRMNSRQIDKKTEK